MKFHPTNLAKVALLHFVLFLSISCNKDSDLLAEFVVEKPHGLLVNNIVVTLANQPIVIKPHVDDIYEEPETITVTGTTPPAMGSAVVNGDNTITYTPDPDQTGTDAFDYTANITNPDNSVSTETGKVTVTVTDKVPTTKPTEMGELKAFPGAEGFGKNTTGGRGGKVIPVTNLNDSGTGSLRAALEANGARTVIFRVGGTIKLKSTIRIQNGDLTVAGETAPGGGILIRDGMLRIEDSNIIIRHLRFRMGPNGPSTDDNFSITAWNGKVVEDIIVDHCSFSWGNDENFNLRTIGSGIVRNVTLQNSILSENGKNILAHHNVQNFTFYQNLTALTFERNIRANYGFKDVFKFEMVNNLIYGWKNAATNPSLGQKYTILNNKYKKSNDISEDSKTVIGASAAESGVPNSWTYAYVEGNIIPSGFNLHKSTITPYLYKKPFASSGLTSIAYAADLIEETILPHVGASLPKRDAVDTRIINSYKTASGVVSFSGTYPNIINGTPYIDADGDGMDDNWELANNLDPKNPSDGQKDRNGDGYTNLEEFLYYLTIL